MTNKIYTLYDRETELWSSALMFDINDRQAIRKIVDACFTPKPEIPPQKYPRQFEVYRLGTYDLDKGEIVMDKQPLGNLYDLMAESVATRKKDLQAVKDWADSLIEDIDNGNAN